ncbi:MAG: hypothetical protein V4611_03460 [Patescibacteria group bacterium]
MRYRFAHITLVVFAAVVMTGCAATADVSTPNPEPTKHHAVHTEPKDPEADFVSPPMSPQGPFSGNPVDVGDVSWTLGGGSGGGSGDSFTRDAQEYVLLLSPDQMVAYEAAGNLPGEVTSQLAEQLCPAAVIDALQLRIAYPSISIAYVVRLAE